MSWGIVTSSRYDIGIGSGTRKPEQLRPALGLFADHISHGRSYSPARFLTLYTAMEATRGTVTGAELPCPPRLRGSSAGDQGLHQSSSRTHRGVSSLLRASGARARGASHRRDRNQRAALNAPRVGVDAGLPPARSGVLCREVEGILSDYYSRWRMIHERCRARKQYLAMLNGAADRRHTFPPST